MSKFSEMIPKAPDTYGMSSYAYCAIVYLYKGTDKVEGIIFSDNKIDTDGNVVIDFPFRTCLPRGEREHISTDRDNLPELKLEDIRGDLESKGWRVEQAKGAIK
ncbi:hypothetical protein JHD46_05475 [Sulfurimonas sp. SAG-AH-194-C20]|nr:hypothetical protein [Sulfurimonas sp. SAG-AH-194-C20]MDF1879090.1 hypothetical protein [Sulfurimonas sp. SAG-AH-194-C20]